MTEGTTNERSDHQGVGDKPHFWFTCDLCGPAVMCGKCGNNACNAAYGRLADGSVCDACPEAYAMQDRGDGLDEFLRANPTRTEAP